MVLNGPFLIEKLRSSIWHEIQQLPDFDEALFEKVRAQIAATQAGRGETLQKLTGRVKDLTCQVERVTKAIADVGLSPALKTKLHELEVALDDAKGELQILERNPPTQIQMPSVETIRKRANELFGNFDTCDPDVYRLLTRLVPDLRVYPVRLCDNGAVVLRARLTLCLAALMPPGPSNPEVDSVLNISLTVDLFDHPQRAAHREQIMLLREREGMPEWKIAEGLGLTITATQRAAALDRAMKKQGLTDPYVEVSEPPAENGNLRRHRHKRYRFEPVKDSCITIS